MLTVAGEKGDSVVTQENVRSGICSGTDPGTIPVYRVAVCATHDQVGVGSSRQRIGASAAVVRRRCESEAGRRRLTE